MMIDISQGINVLKRKAFWTAFSMVESMRAAYSEKRPFPPVQGPFNELKNHMLSQAWGLLQQHDKLALLNGLERLCSEKNQILICELGVASGKTGNRMVEFALAMGETLVKYYGIDDLSLSGKKPDFAFVDVMSFIDGNYQALAALNIGVDFGLVDACHCSECVYTDSIAMSRKVVVGGMMAFHDTSMNSQFPNSPLGKNLWQHYCKDGESERPLAVLEGIAMARHNWEGEWKLIIQEGDHLEWGGVRIYQRLS